MVEDESFAGRRDRLENGGEEAGDDTTRGEDREAEAKREHTRGEEEGLTDKVKEKGKELLDTISGPDVPPSPEDEKKR